MSGCGGMADAQDSKSCGGNLVWVQVPPPAFDVNSLENSKEFFWQIWVYILEVGNVSDWNM